MDIKLSSYRLGDLVFLQLKEDEQKNILNNHPDSIGAEYINIIKKLTQMKYRLNIFQKIEIITKIALKHCIKYKDLYPDDIKNSTLVHLRLGDVISGTHSYEKIRRPLPVEILKKVIPKNNKLYIIGKPFFGKPSSTNYEECVINSEKYLQDALTELNGTHFDGNSADADLCCALNAKCFVQGKGYYSKLIVEMRKKLKLQNIEINFHS